MYSYDRSKTAASMNLYREWRDMVNKADRDLRQEFSELLKKAVPYLKSVGYDLDVSKSYLDKEPRGSDGDRLIGMLYVTEREENNVVAPNAESVRRWVDEALGLWGRPRKVSEGPGTNRAGQPLASWEVDLGE